MFFLLSRRNKLLFLGSNYHEKLNELFSNSNLYTIRIYHIFWVTYKTKLFLLSIFFSTKVLNNLCSFTRKLDSTLCQGKWILRLYICSLICAKHLLSRFLEAHDAVECWIYPYILIVIRKNVKWQVDSISMTINWLILFIWHFSKAKGGNTYSFSSVFEIS